MSIFSLQIKPEGMPLDVLEQTARKTQALPLPRHEYFFQGGEPLSVGMDFYQMFIGYVKQYTQQDSQVSYSIRTNGKLITDGWAQFFSAHEIFVTVCLDGVTGAGDIDAGVLAGISRLKKFNVPFEARVIVNAVNVSNPETLYRYLRDEVGCNAYHFVPCTEPGASALTAEQWGDFLCRLYDMWFPTDTQKVTVHFFNTILAQMVDGVAISCECSGDCRATLVIEPTGDIYPCELNVAPEWKLGNIMQDSLLTLLGSPLYETFGTRKQKWPTKCNTCDALRYCLGDCVKNRDADGNSTLCAGLEKFYAHALPTLSKLGWQLYQKINGLKPGRNDPCPCGSGKKLKKCCGKATAAVDGDDSGNVQ